MRLFATLLSAASLVAALPAAATEVEVTRFHTPATLTVATPGPIAVRGSGALADNSLQSSFWLDAVAQELQRQGFTVVADAPRVAEVSLTQQVVEESRARSGSGVSVGVGMGTGSGWYGRGGGTSVGMGVGIDLTSLFRGKGGRGALDSQLAVTIKDSAGAHLWEGRAEALPRESSKDAEPRRLAGEMAEALFTGFPGPSGETIAVR